MSMGWRGRPQEHLRHVECRGLLCLEPANVLCTMALFYQEKYQTQANSRRFYL